jgi:hypothetical protein
VDNYRALLAQVGTGRLQLANENFDLGIPTTQPGHYRGSDQTYAKLVDKLAGRQFAGISEELRTNILEFYRDAHAPLPGMAKPKEIAEWASLQEKVARLQAIAVSGQE